MLHTARFLLGTARDSILQNKGRSLLTILSIIIGIATVIATLAIGRGAQEKIKSRLASMGTNVLALYPGSNGLITGTSGKPGAALTLRDVSFLKSLDPAITAASGVCRYKEVDVVYQNKKLSAPLIGAQPEILTITNRPLKCGRNFLLADLHTKASVVILGSKSADILFKGANPLGKKIRVDSTICTVIGVLAQKENPHAFQDINQDIYIPLSTAKRMTGKGVNDIVHNIIMSIDPTADIQKVERLITRTLRARHQLSPSTPDDFTLWNQSSMMAAAEESSQTFNLFLLIVASLSLLVGGLGISNIMLVTVTERTKEIGIRMALGASPALILSQFLLEATLLCVIGGLLGTILGISVPFILAFFIDWTVVVTPQSVFWSIVVTTAIGLLFGFLPARRAARLTIVDALNDR